MMEPFYINSAKKLNKKNSTMYLTTATLKEIKSWELANSSAKHTHEVIYIVSEDITIINETGNLYDIKVPDAYLLSTLPSNNELEDEYPVLISSISNITIIINSLLQIESFNKYIDLSNNKISKNSTKIMTLKTLERIVTYVFGESSVEEIIALEDDFIEYIKHIIHNHDFLRYYSLRHIQELKRNTIINSSFSWFILFKYFKDNYQRNVYNQLKIPKLDLEICIGNWNGKFFDKDNPIWEKIFINSKRFYPSENSLNSSYKLWTELFKKSL